MIERAGEEDAAVVVDVHGRPAILVGSHKQYFAVINQPIHMKHVTRHELFQHEKRLLIAQAVQQRPQLIRRRSAS